MKHLESRRCVLAHTNDPERPRTASRGWLCEGHWLGLEQHIAELPALADEVERSLVRSSNAGPKISGDPERALPYDEAAADALHSVKATLVSWSRLVLDEHPSRLHSPLDTIPALATFLQVHLDWCAEQTWISDLHREIVEERLGLRRASNPRHKRTVVLGHCGGTTHCDVATHTEQGECEGDLQAVLADDDSDTRPVTCTDCGAQHQPDTWRALARRLRKDAEPMLTYAQLSQLFAVPIGTLKRWKHEDGWRGLGTRPERMHLDDAQRSFDTHQRDLEEAS